MFQRQPLDLVIVKHLGFGIKNIIHNLIKSSAEVDLQSVTEMSAFLDRQTENSVARIQYCHKRSDIGICSAVRLHICKVATKEFLCAISCEIFDLIVKLAASVITLAGISLCVFVGHPRSRRMHHCIADMIFAGDQFESCLLTVALAGKNARDIWIRLFEKCEKIVTHVRDVL